MEVAASMVVRPLLTAAMNTLMPKMLRFIEDKCSLRQDVKNDIKSLMKELEMMWSAVQQYRKSRESKDLGGVQATWIKQVSQLADRIEDCMDSYIYDQIARSTEVPNPDWFAGQIRTFKRESSEISILRERYKIDDTGVTSSERPSAEESSSSRFGPPVLPIEKGFLGREVPLSELLDLVEEEDETNGQQKKLKVISIHGFDGLGKTALATEIYHHEDVVKKFDKNRAWVNVAGKDPRQVLQEILQQLQPCDTSNAEQLCKDLRASNAEKLCKQLRKFLEKKRYFIVIDDMRTHLWRTLEPAFPKNDGYSSRVVVTTSMRKIANECCSTTGYMYRIEGLDASFSEDLLFRSADVDEPSEEMKIGSKELLMKCNGLPLALVSVGEHLNLTREGLTVTGITCKNVCRNLGNHLEVADKHTALARMQEVLVRSYNCVPEDTAKASLVCIGMFPRGYRIRRKRLIRRWFAEGLFKKDSSYHMESTDNKAVQIFKTLTDLNIVQPIDVSNNDQVRSCQPPGMMLEFIRHRSMSENSTTLFCNEMHLKVPKYARHLSLHHATAAPLSVQQECDLSLVRSLTIFGKASQHILNFNKYHLLRVLDLEECDDLTNDHLSSICKLFLLKYLSLGGTVNKLPKEIAKLKCLETLDVRRANVEVLLPIDVIMLTTLSYLFGKFKLLENVSKKIPEFFKSGKSNLEILAGLIVTDTNDSFLQLIAHMKNLRKLKIWCNSSAGSSNLTNLSSAIQRYIEDGTDPNIDRSLCLDSDVSFKNMPQFSPEGDFCISSLKLRGDLLELPQFVASLLNLSELCLSSTTTLRGNLLTILSKLTCLVYLKLMAAELDNFVITDETKFQSLQRLCLVAQHLPVLEVQGNPLPKLVSFQLLCNNNVDLSLINIERIGIKYLREVTIYEENNEESRRTWKEAAKKHPNRPRIFFIEKECGHAEPSVPTEQPPPQNRNKWKFLLSVLPKCLQRNKEIRARSSALVGTNNGHLDSTPLAHEATGVAHAETSGSTTAPDVSSPTEAHQDD